MRYRRRCVGAAHFFFFRVCRCRLARNRFVPHLMNMRDLGFEAFQEQACLGRQRAPRRLDHHEFGVQLRRDNRIDDQFAAADVVDRNDARQHRNPVRPRDEFERRNHRVHFQHGPDLDAVALKVGIEVAAPDIVRARDDDLERRNLRQSDWLE